MGIGYDSHRFDAGRALILGGVRFPESPGLKGFSDGDAVTHAVIDAVLGAAALGDIALIFPPGRQEWRDADSMQLLSRVMVLLDDASWRVGNVDVTVICEAPRIGPRVPQMRSALGRCMGIQESHVSVKGKSNEGMGWIGRGEGIAVLAVASSGPGASAGHRLGNRWSRPSTF